MLFVLFSSSLSSLFWPPLLPYTIWTSTVNALIAPSYNYFHPPPSPQKNQSLDYCHHLHSLLLHLETEHCWQNHTTTQLGTTTYSRSQSQLDAQYHPLIISLVLSQISLTFFSMNVVNLHYSPQAIIYSMTSTLSADDKASFYVEDDSSTFSPASL